MAQNMLVVGGNGPLYRDGAPMALLLKIPGRTTGQRILLSPAATLPPAAWVAAAHSSVGWAGAALTARGEGVSQGRPVYLLRAKAGEVAILVGPRGASGTHPANQRWFRDLLARPHGDQFRSLKKSDSSVPVFADLASRVQWELSKDVLYGQTVSTAESFGINGVSEGSMLVYNDINQAPAAVQMWRKRTLLGGIHMLWVRETRWMALPSSHLIEPGISSFNLHGSGAVKEPGMSPRSAATYAETASWGVVASDMKTLTGQHGNFGGAYRTFIGGSDRSYTLDFGMFSYTGVRTPGFIHNNHTSWVVNEAIPLPYFLSDELDRGPWDGFTAVLRANGLATGEGRLPVGSFFPFPLTSTLVGYAYGLPDSGDNFIYEFKNVTDKGEGLVTADLVMAQADVTGAQYKRLFPLDTLPEDKRTAMEGPFAELPDDVRFRVAYKPVGFKYGAVRYDQTRLAVDMARANSDLNEILFDHTDPSKPPVGYGSLGAESLKVIGDKRNDTLAIALHPDGDTGLDLAPIVFSREAGFIVATAGGVQRDSGEVLTSIRAGASYSVSGVTLDEVAFEFFLQPTWADVMALTDEVESSDYVLDETRLLAELTFDGTTEDELARALPSLLGFPRHEFGAMIRGVMMGMAVPEIVP